MPKEEKGGVYRLEGSVGFGLGDGTLDLAQTNPPSDVGPLGHSDRGKQHTSGEYQEQMREADIVSM